MSRSGPRTKGTPRTKDDVYPTPWPLPYYIALRLKQEFGDWKPDVIIEASAGAGVFVYACKLVWPDVPVVAVEIRPEEEQSLRMNGADTICIQSFEEFAKRYRPPKKVLVIGNPPFSLAEEHLLILLDMLYAGSRIAWLLKLNFESSYDRAMYFWSQPQTHYDYKIPIVGRPSFKKTKLADNATDEYAVWVWEVGKIGKGETRWPHIFWREYRGGKKRRKKPDRTASGASLQAGSGAS